jgi:hypothetical protein
MFVREVKVEGLERYVREQLASGYTALSEIVSRTVAINGGRYFLISPDVFDPARVENWNWDPGGVKASIADDLLAKEIHAYLQSIGNRVVIQDFELKRSDPCFTDDPRRVFYGENVYWELQETDISEEKILDCINDTSHWPWLCFFCKQRQTKNRFIDDGELEEVANQLVGIGVQALHDSYVIWWRPGSETLPKP